VIRVAFDALLAESLFVLRLCLVLLLAAPASPLEQARQASDKAHFEEVVRLLRGRDFVAPSDRADAHFLLGVAELALGNDTLSQKSLVQLFTESPDFTLPPYTAPKVAAACERARKQVVIVLHPRTEAGRVLVCGDGLSQQASVRVTFVSGAGEDVGQVMPAPPCFAAPIPHLARGYYVVVSGTVFAGSREAPLPLDSHVLAAAAPWYKKWWPWTILGVVVAGGATAAVLATTLHKSGPGTVRFTVVQP
jgi:hypothetical protein